MKGERSSESVKELPGIVFALCGLVSGLTSFREKHILYTFSKAGSIVSSVAQALWIFVILLGVLVNVVTAPQGGTVAVRRFFRQQFRAEAANAARVRMHGSVT